MVRGTQGPLARLFEQGSVAGMTDGQLLDRFTTRRGDAAEAAFEALVARHGPMVARVCRSCLRDEHDVEDAFQATFLVLVRRAGAIGECDLLAPWLYGVAHRVARKARAVAAKRRGREGGPANIDPPARADASITLGVDLGPVLHEEVDRLPAKYRQPVILCHLQGLTHAQAAQELAWPVGTVSVRLARARKILADRLARRGVTASVTVVAGALATEATAATLAPSWIHAAAVAALTAASGLPLTTAALSAGAITLARRTSMTMLLSSWKWLALPAIVALTTATGAALVGSAAPGDQPQGAPTATKVVPPASAEPSSRVDFTGTVTTRPAKDGYVNIEAENAVTWGKLGDLSQTIEQFRESDPTATFRLQLSNGRIRIRRPVPPVSELKASKSMTDQQRGAAEFDRVAESYPAPSSFHFQFNDVASLTKRLEELQRQSPNSIYQIELSDGKIDLTSTSLKGEIAPPLGEQKTTKTLAPPSVGVAPRVEDVDIHGFKYPAPTDLLTAAGHTTLAPLTTPTTPEFVVNLTGSMAPSSRRTLYELTVTNTGSAPARAVVVTASLPKQGGKLAQKPLPPNATFLSKDRQLVWKIPQLEVGQTVAYGFLYENTTPGLYHCEVEAVSGSLRTTKQLEIDVPPVADLLKTLPDGQVELGDIPPGYFDLPAPKFGEPGAPQPVRIGQTLLVEALEGLPGRPITGERVVRTDGTISLGFYGDLSVAGLNRNQIKVKLLEKLRNYLSDSILGLYGFKDGKVVAIPRVDSNRVYIDDQPNLPARPPAAQEPATKSAATTMPPSVSRPIPVKVGQTLVIEVLEALPGRPISGERVVRTDGTVGLGFYGDVAVAGLTREQIKVKVIELLRAKLSDEQLGLAKDVGGEKKTIAPVDSDCVFVDDAVPRPEPRAADQVKKLSEQVTDLSGKLDAALGAIEQLRRERPRDAVGPPRR